jgi:hypothetical protein
VSAPAFAGSFARGNEMLYSLSTYQVAGDPLSRVANLVLRDHSIDLDESPFPPIRVLELGGRVQINQALRSGATLSLVSLDDPALIYHRVELRRDSYLHFANGSTLMISTYGVGATVVPEPGSGMLVAAGCAALLAFDRSSRRRRLQRRR